MDLVREAELLLFLTLVIKAVRSVVPAGWGARGLG